MSDKIRLVVEIHEIVTETHEVIVDKKAYDKIGFSISDYISEDSVIDRDWSTCDYEIREEAEINELEKTTTA